jgi:Arc/MetJ-type ribon-helix-helix transcriptional regulator
MTIEITDRMMEYVDRKVASGAFKDDVVQMLLDAALRAEARGHLERELLAGIDDIEQGKCTPWKPGEHKALLQELIRQRSAIGQK